MINEKRLRELLTYHEHAADSIRTVMALANGHAVKAKQNGHATVLAHALALDADRREVAPAKRKYHKGHTAAVTKRRAHTKAFLDHFSTTTPRTTTEGMKLIGSMVRYGYLKAKGDGYLRTDKPFTP